MFHTEESGAIEDFKVFINDLSMDEVLLRLSSPILNIPVSLQDFVIIREKRVPLGVIPKGKVSLEKAAFLAGMNIESYLDYLKR